MDSAAVRTTKLQPSFMTLLLVLSPSLSSLVLILVLSLFVMMMMMMPCHAPCADQPFGQESASVLGCRHSVPVIPCVAPDTATKSCRGEQNFQCSVLHIPERDRPDVARCCSILSGTVNDKLMMVPIRPHQDGDSPLMGPLVLCRSLFSSICVWNGMTTR